MFRPVRYLLAAFAPLALLGAAPAADSSAKIRQRIDALLTRRLLPEPLPADLPNPFESTTAAARSRVIARTEPAEKAVATDPDREAVPARHGDLLADYAARLRISGIMRLKDQILVVINDTPRKEGDLIPVPSTSPRVHLQISRLLPDRVVFRYLDAEIALSL